MTNLSLTLESVSFTLPDGTPVFSELSERFDARHTGLVGDNGAGKSLLARILAGLVMPTSGQCGGTRRVRYLPQHLSALHYPNVAALAGVDARLDALARIEGGGCNPADFDLVGDDWDLRQRLQTQLFEAGLGHLNADSAVDRLSGGEAMRVALAGALLADTDFLILDEPSNPLDLASRRDLMAQLRRWPRGLLVISHDRSLLQQMDRIVELSSLGLRSYGGNYAFYQQMKAQEATAAVQKLERLKTERKREDRALREQRERQDKRQSRGDRQGKLANQAKILLGGQKNRSESSAGKLARQQAETQAQRNQQVREAAGQIATQPSIVMHSNTAAGAVPHNVAQLSNAVLPHSRPPFNRLSLTLSGGQRLGVVGANGCGKSTLLNVLASRQPLLSGQADVRVKVGYLDQQLSLLSPEKTVLEQLLAVNRQAGEAQLRMRLAQLGLDATRIAIPCAQLSGGEQLKAALATVIYADDPAQCLLLDEPSNHLDLPSLLALESLLNHYTGTLVVVSHDSAFLDSLHLTHRLIAEETGWQCRPEEVELPD